MAGVFRILLMWLIALAVPLQGFAAAAMPGCGLSHHAMAAPASVAAFDDDSLMAMSPAHMHISGMESPGASHKAVKGSCTPCAACCVGAALPVAAMTFEPVVRADLFTLSVQDDAVSFLTDGLDRPPRSFLA